MTQQTFKTFPEQLKPQDISKFEEAGVTLPESTLERVDAALAKGMMSTCCGHLPCKGRKVACYACPLCMDCITGKGCSHPHCNHEPYAFNAAKEEPDGSSPNQPPPGS